MTPLCKTARGCYHPGFEDNHPTSLVQRTGGTVVSPVRPSDVTGHSDAVALWLGLG